MRIHIIIMDHAFYYIKYGIIISYLMGLHALSCCIATWIVHCMSIHLLATCRHVTVHELYMLLYVYVQVWVH